MNRKGLLRMLLNRWSAFTHDLLWVPAAFLLAFWLRFNLGEIPAPFYTRTWQLIALVLPFQAVIFWRAELYRGVWRFASVPDLVRIVKAAGLGALAVVVVSIVIFRLENVPRSVFLLYPLLLAIGLAGPRLVYRGIKDRGLHLHRQEGKRTLILGAGSAGESLVRHLIRHEEYLPVAFLDDDQKKHGREIHGIRVVGSLREMRDVIDRLLIDAVLLAIPAADGALVRWVIDECRQAGVICRTLPSLVELGNRQIDAGHLRPFTIEDLLGRASIRLDTGAIAGYLKGRCVLVTGGGGSIGSELCRQIGSMNPRLLLIFEHSEYNLYAIEQELRRTLPHLELACLLGDVKDWRRVDWVFQQYRPEVVFHAAAYKHVPMLEGNPAEGVYNNVTGSRMIAEAADRYGTERFVLVSTDKAVNPANVMGTTKRIAEIYCQNLALRSRTRFITTRFGNVLGSTGSVVPLFEEQIRRGGPLTVTHPEITRYFMTIREAVGLILQAGAMGDGGEIFVLDMGKPIPIRELAEQMIRLSGLEPGVDIKIVYTGLRSGEKLFEQVFHEQEDLRGTGHPKLLLAGSRQVDWDWLLAELNDLERAARSRDIDVLLRHLKNVVPEFTDAVPARNVEKFPQGKSRFRIVEGRGKE